MRFSSDTTWSLAWILSSDVEVWKFLAQMEHRFVRCIIVPQTPDTKP